MGKKAAKASRKYAASGKLKKEIQARKKHQQIKRTIEKRKGAKGRGKPDAPLSGGEAASDDEEEDEEDGDPTHRDVASRRFVVANNGDAISRA